MAWKWGYSTPAVITPKRNAGILEQRDNAEHVLIRPQYFLLPIFLTSCTEYTTSTYWDYRLRQSHSLQCRLHKAHTPRDNNNSLLWVVNCVFVTPSGLQGKVRLRVSNGSWLDKLKVFVSRTSRDLIAVFVYRKVIGVFVTRELHQEQSILLTISH